MRNRIKKYMSLCLCLCLLVSQGAYATEFGQDQTESETLSSEAANQESSEIPQTPNESVSSSETQESSITQTESNEDDPISESSDIQSSEQEIVTLQTENAPSEPAAAFVSRLYTTILGRQADEEGLNTWVSELKSGNKTGSDIIIGFIFSEEFTNKNLSNEDYVETLYQAIFNRSSDSEGKSTWIGVLEEGFSRWYVCSGFTASSEFWLLCDSYGIQTGSIPLSEITDLNPMTTQFVNRLYRLIFNRKADSEGLNTWVSELSSHRKTAAEVLCGFIYSTEFTIRSFDDSEYIEILYNTLLDRPSDSGGKQDWLNTLNNGMSRDYILYNFVASTEFAKLCESYGIETGSIYLSQSRDQNQKLTKYVLDVYENCMNRKASDNELNEWTQRLSTHTFTVSDFLYTLIFSPEGSSHTQSNEDFARILFKTTLLRDLPEESISEWATKASTSRTDTFNEITGSKEFKQLCDNYGLAYTVKDGWADFNGNIYYYLNGQKVSGWQRIDGNLYYFNPNDGNRQIRGWGYVDGYKYYFNNQGILVQNVDSIIGKQSRYKVMVNTYTNTVTVLAQDGANGYIIPVKNMICSCGTFSTPTVSGTYTIQRIGYWWELMGPVWGQYVSRIHNDYLFHSAWYYVNGNKRTLSVSEYRKLGTNASHGCVRMTVGDAKWIFDNCNGSQVTVYGNWNQLTKFDKPARPNPVVLSGDYGYDPTDPSFR